MMTDRRQRWVRVALVLVSTVFPACADLGKGEGLDSDAVRSSLERASGISLDASAPPDGPVGLPDLEVSYSGGDRSESIDVLVFFDAEAADGPVGRASARSSSVSVRPTAVRHVVALRRSNVLVLYRRESGAPRRLAALRAALKRL